MVEEQLPSSNCPHSDTAHSCASEDKTIRDIDQSFPENLDIDQSFPENLGIRSVPQPAGNESQCSNCKFFKKMHHQARVYYQSAALKLSQAKAMEKRSVRRMEKAKKFYEARFFRIPQTPENMVDKENIETFQRKAALRARVALKTQKDSKCI